MGYSPKGHKRVGHDLATTQQQQQHMRICVTVFRTHSDNLGELCQDLLHNHICKYPFLSILGNIPRFYGLKHVYFYLVRGNILAYQIIL